MDKRAEVAAYFLSGLLCCVALIWALQLWRADLGIPLYYGAQSDLMLHCMLAKAMIQNGWYMHNPHLGAPGVQNMLDFPMPDALHFLLTKVISWLTGSWGAAVNIYFLLGFVANAWSMLAVLRYFKIARAPAVVTAVLFAFLPYHFYRSENHLHFSAYFVIPLAGIMLLWIMLDESLFVPVRRGRFLILPAPTRKGIAALIICGVLGSSGVYHAFLTILLLVAAGLYRVFDERALHRVAAAGILSAAIVTTVALNLLPNMVHILVDGRNPEVAVRVPSEAETYALKLTQLILPVTGHRIPRMAAAKAAYNGSSGTFPISEGDGSALGICFAMGFCFLLLTLIGRYPWPRHRKLIDSVGPLNLCAFLIGTVGGVGSIIALTVSPEIRAYARLGIYIAFFSALALAAVLDEILARWAGSRVRVWFFHAALAAILVGGLLDQTTLADVPPYDVARQQYGNDAEFAERAERLLPPGTMVLQLPYARFPEYPPPGIMYHYDHLRPYLHSTSLRWSFGALKGRYWDAWERDLSAQPVADMVDSACAAGFGAIYVDRNGYADRGAVIQAALGGMGLTPIESGDRRFWLYNIGPYSQRLQSQLGSQEWSRAREATLNPPELRWVPEFSGLERNAEHNWRWFSSEGWLRVENPAAQERRIEIRGVLSEGSGAVCAIVMAGPGVDETFPMNGNIPQTMRRALVVSSGITTYRLSSNCPRLENGDPRQLVFRLDDFQAVLANAAPALEVVWGAGFYPPEKAAAKPVRWCSSSGELTITNRGPAVESSMQMTLASTQDIPSPISITGPGFDVTVTVGAGGAAFSKTFRVSSGESTIRFSSRAAPVESNSKPVFRIEDFHFGNSLIEPHVIYVN